MEISDLAGEGRAYGNLGIANQSLGDYRKAIDYHEKEMKVAIELGDPAGEGRACGGLGNAYQSLGDYPKAIEYHEKWLQIATEIGDRAAEGGVYGGLGNAYQSLGNYRKAIEYHEKQLKIAKEIGDQSLGDYRRAIECYEKHLKIAVEIGDQEGEGIACHNIGNIYFRLGQFETAVDNFVSAVEAFNALRSLLRSEDNWKINFRELNEASYTFLWMSLLRNGRVDEALLAAEQGRAQTLSDNLLIQYKLHASISAATIDTKETIFRPFTELSSPTLFLAIEGLRINIWFLIGKRKVIFREGMLEGDRTERDPVRALLQSCLEKIGIEDIVRCEDRTFDELTRDCPSSREVCKQVKKPFPSSDNHFKPFYDAVIGPIVDMLGPQDDELLIVPDGALCFTPWAAVIESIRIRTAPSLTNDEATMVFMKSFYQHLKKGKTASAAVYQSIKSLRNSEKFSDIAYWAPFQLIGDDVKMEFEADVDVEK
ncbi:tetratricopeptide repeat protein 28-like [Acropora millepora]|uniref:tetratricopeptide repeat protein 28-like n=1 Tax=Acropora millepora TaxID=45264 RepID=UPI001CF4196F|nr:tetratricopeptide repeat protein 28-like [Acropora millepora]